MRSWIRENGKIYQCEIDVMNEGRELDVRGYTGIRLLGRSQVWYRVEESEEDDRRGHVTRPGSLEDRNHDRTGRGEDEK